MYQVTSLSHLSIKEWWRDQYVTIINSMGRARLTDSQCEARNQRRQQPAAAWHFMIISTISTREYLLCSLFSQHQPVSALLTDFVIQMFYLSFGIRMERLEEQQQQSSFSGHRLHQYAEILTYLMQIFKIIAVARKNSGLCDDGEISKVSHPALLCCCTLNWKTWKCCVRQTKVAGAK